LKPEIKKIESTMTNSKRITQLAKKWQRMAELGRKHLNWGPAKEYDECCASVAGNGHCVVYTIDRKRFDMPLIYLGKKVFEELLWMSQEEFGFVIDGRIMLPCDAATLEYAMCLVRSISTEVESAFLSNQTIYHFLLRNLKIEFSIKNSKQKNRSISQKNHLVFDKTARFFYFLNQISDFEF
jgi:hypothetical protein